jgi:DHA2 family integral membrane protein (MFS transporter)
MTTLGAHSTVALVSVIAVVLGAGIGLCLAPATALITSTLPPSSGGVTAAINTVSRETGGALGIAVLGSILTWEYGRTIASWMRLHGVVGPLQATVKSSLGGALAVAHHVPSPKGSALATAANAAFLHAMHVTLIAGLAVVTLGIAIAATPLSRARPDSRGRVHGQR